MADKKGGGGGDNQTNITSPPSDNADDKAKNMCCEDFLSQEDLTVGKIAEEVEKAEENVSSSDEVDEELETEYYELNDVLDLPEDTYSLTKINPLLPACVKYGMRSGTTHFNMSKFSPLSRGLQGSACAIAGFTTNAVLKSRCWNELVIDQIIDDGDSYYSESYENIETDDRRMVTVRDLKRDIAVLKTHYVYFDIDDAAYVGTFRSENPKEMHLVKALDLFFKQYDAGLLTSSKLNVSIWKDSKFYYIFDGQARGEDCLPVKNRDGGSAKLILVRDLTGVIFIILEKSDVSNEPFVLFPIAIINANRIPSHPDDPEEPVKSIGEPKRRPSGYKIQEQFRALVQGTYHIMHPKVPTILQGRGHLIIAVAALIYSRLINANKWSSVIIDLIFNQAHIYMIDLVRALEKKIDDTFELKIDELMGDVILGVYFAKINVTANVVPGDKKKGKSTVDTGIREFFQQNQSGILEIKKYFFAIWKEGNKYYFLDPFGCDDEGFRIDPNDPEDAQRYNTSKPCATMNSSINQLVETILYNTGSKDKDPFVIHALRILYVKTGTAPGGPIENVIYREKRTNRRPLQQESNKAGENEVDDDECKFEIDMVPKPRPDAEKTRDEQTQFPELMRNAVNYMMKEDEPTSFIIKRPSVELLESPSREASEEFEELDSKEPEVQYVYGYRVVNAHRLLLQGEKNCFSMHYEERVRGRQGLIIALTAMSYGRLKPPYTWRNIDVNQILDVGNTAYNNTIDWIQHGSPAETENKENGGDKKSDDGEGEGQEDEPDREDEENEADEDEEGGAVKGEFKGPLQPAPSHLDVALLPDKIKLVDNETVFKKKINFAEGDANPLANLGEALEHYLERYNELVVENKKLMFGIWKDDGKYYLFNPYGSDEEGRRLRGYPAAMIVTDTIIELTDVLYEILEYNDSKFNFHYIGIQSIQPNDKYTVPELVEIPEGDPPLKYNTVFLPVTDEDLFVPEPEPESEELEIAESEKIKESKGDNEEENEEADEEEEEEQEDEAEEEEEMGETPPSPEPEKPIIDPLLEIEEQEQPDAPDELNLSLLSGTIIVDEEEERMKEEMNEALAYEKLKYKHPPPYVLPPKKVLCVLLEAKKASKSAHSLLSRFSIDSMLSIKKESDLPAGTPTQQPIITAVNIADGDKVSKLIKLPPKKYFVSRLPPTGFTPIRAINDKYLQDEDSDRTKVEECRKRKLNETPKVLGMEDVPEIPTTVRIKPILIPLGPPIKTPTPKKKPKSCAEKKKRSCQISTVHKEDPVLERIMCETEDLLLDMMFPDPNPDIQTKKTVRDKKERCKEKKKGGMSNVRMKAPSDKPVSPPSPERCGFKMTEEEVGVINGNMCLENRGMIEECHFKQCYFAAILCVLAKIRMDVTIFRGSILDQFILVGDKIYQRTGKLRYKAQRWFYNIEILGTKYNIILRQIVYADPENCSEEELPSVISNYLENNQSGILVFPSVCYAFWYGKEKYYLFDPYGCDEDGYAKEDGFACLMQFPDLQSMIDRIKNNTGEIADKVFRIHAIAIAHVEPIKQRKTKHKKRIGEILNAPPKQELPSEPEPVLSLIELSDWVTKTKKSRAVFDMTISGYAAIPNFNASTLEVIVLENDITDPIKTEFRKRRNSQNKPSAGDTDSALADLVRKKPYDKKFKEHGFILEAIDLCIMAWACIHDPTLWGTKTIKGLCDAGTDLTQDCILASEDTTLSAMTDGVLPEFTIANYNFRAKFAPLHHGTLYEITGWNLAMSLKKILSIQIYSGAVIICGKAHIGVMKKKENYYAWWVIPKTKKLKIITSEEMEDFLKLIVIEINEPDEIEFLIRAVTISYARKMAPDCEDTAGLHERAVPATSLAQIHRKQLPPYDIEAIFRKTVPETRPIFVQGTVAIRNRDILKEPRVKRCYFIAVLAVMLKRDIIQSAVTGTIDKLIEIAEGLYKEFDEPKYHTEHILKNVTIMNRIFDFRDCASPLVDFQSDSTTRKSDHHAQVKQYLKRHFKKHSDGIIHFTNCCYGFWYSRSTNSYYYLDPYQCDAKGKKVSSDGSSCLCIFPSLCLMAKHMYQNQFENCTGFFIHRIHVESINVPPFKKLQEDPMWVYLDFHWSFSHAPDITKSGKKKKQTTTNQEKPSWNYYAIEVPNLIYSVWGTLGCYDPRFGQRAGKNQAGISVAVLAMQFLCHPSRWGPAILDSAVICGDCYHTESLRSAVRSGCRHPNRFNLQSTFKVFPHIWTLEFGENMCGILYGGRDRLTLAATLKLAFNEAPNVILECNKATFSVLTAEDGYYVADPRWTGPPLFTRNHGALYVLRCRNMNALVYALTKMLNTNQRLEFHITPVLLTFAQESCQLGGEKALSKTQKQILLDPICRSPTRTGDPGTQIPGAITTPDEDSYLVYRRSLREGRRHGAELENPPLRSPEPKLPAVNANNTLVSTMWHVNVGHPMAHKHSRKPNDVRHGIARSGLTSGAVEYRKPVSREADRDYPRLVDFVRDAMVQPAATDIEISDFDANPDPLTEMEIIVPPLCIGVPSFIEDASQVEFSKTVKEMADEYFKKYKHRVTAELQAAKEVETDVKKKKKKKVRVKEEKFDDQSEVEAVAADPE